VAKSEATSERSGAFSDGVFAVIITIMVLDLRPPPQATLAALLRLWPAALSYVVSYLFIAIVWVNHHHLLRFAEHATSRLIWVNFAHLFMVSLVPFSTAWVADTRLAAVPVFVYAAVFVLVNLALLRFRVGGAGSGRGRGGLGPDAADHANAIVPDVGNVRDCDVTVTQVSFVGLWVGLLRFACLSSAGSPFPVACSLEGAIAIGTNLELV
jgi:hypothetical protein